MEGVVFGGGVWILWGGRKSFDGGGIDLGGDFLMLLPCSAQPKRAVCSFGLALFFCWRGGVCLRVNVLLGGGALGT